MKTALVLSGGGAKGGFQVGALKYLTENGFTFDCVAGVSVGSLNGAMVAQGKMEQMYEVWSKITEKSIHKKYSWARILWNNTAGGKKSLYDLRPLAERLKENVNKEDFKIPFYMGITSLRDGQYHSLNDGEFASSHTLRSGIYASSLMPILWEPIDVHTKTERIVDAVDGGVTNVIPLKDILKEGADRIVIIVCNNAKPDPAHQDNIVDVAKRTFMDIMLDEIVRTDIEGILNVNHKLKQVADFNAKLPEGVEPLVLTSKSGRPLKHFEVVLIQPPHKIGSSTDFSREAIDKNLQLGFETAKKVVEGA